MFQLPRDVMAHLSRYEGITGRVAMCPSESSETLFGNSDRVDSCIQMRTSSNDVLSAIEQGVRISMDRLWVVSNPIFDFKAFHGRSSIGPWNRACTAMDNWVRRRSEGHIDLRTSARDGAFERVTNSRVA